MWVTVGLSDSAELHVRPTRHIMGHFGETSLSRYVSICTSLNSGFHCVRAIDASSNGRNAQSAVNKDRPQRKQKCIREEPRQIPLSKLVCVLVSSFTNDSVRDHWYGSGCLIGQNRVQTHERAERYVHRLMCRRHSACVKSNESAELRWCSRSPESSRVDLPVLPICWAA